MPYIQSTNPLEITFVCTKITYSMFFFFLNLIFASTKREDCKIVKNTMMWMPKTGLVTKESTFGLYLLILYPWDNLFDIIEICTFFEAIGSFLELYIFLFNVSWDWKTHFCKKFSLIFLMRKIFHPVINPIIQEKRFCPKTWRDIWLVTLLWSSVKSFRSLFWNF